MCKKKSDADEVCTANYSRILNDLEKQELIENETEDDEEEEIENEGVNTYNENDAITDN